MKTIELYNNGTFDYLNVDISDDTIAITREQREMDTADCIHMEKEHAVKMAKEILEYYGKN
jgi:hypothetical protein